jgi:hypothetical protein
MHAGPLRRAAGAALAGGVVLAGYATLIRPGILRWAPPTRRPPSRCPATR